MKIKRYFHACLSIDFFLKSGIFPITCQLLIDGDRVFFKQSENMPGLHHSCRCVRFLGIRLQFTSVGPIMKKMFPLKNLICLVFVGKPAKHKQLLLLHIMTFALTINLIDVDDVSQKHLIPVR